jgi:hypothetical protein
MAVSIPSGSFKPPPWWVANSKPGATGIEWPPVVGEARHYAQKLQVIAARLDQLNITYTMLDVLLGLPERYSSKCLAVPPQKYFSQNTLDAAFDVLGMDLIAVENAERTASLLSYRHFKQRKYKRHELGSARMRQISTEFLRIMAAKGGFARAAKLSPEQRRRIARKGGRERWRRAKAAQLAAQEVVSNSN